ncbi:MAG: thiol peroxidase [Spirochaetota bacterium]
MERTVTLDKTPLTLIGRRQAAGAPAPNFHVVSPDLKPMTLEDAGDRVKLISFFLSLDTPVCDIQVRELNRRAAAHPEVTTLGISKDLPFAQKRFAETFNLTAIHLNSDYQSSSFGINYGVLIRENGLLARGVVIIDRSNVIRYTQLVREVTNQPDYEEVEEKLAEVLENPSSGPATGTAYRCIPCESGTPPLPPERVRTLLPGAPGWEPVDGRKLVRTFTFRTFARAKEFLDVLSVIAEEQGHHPSFTLTYNRLKVTLTTHASGGLTDNDFTMARIIEQAVA